MMLHVTISVFDWKTSAALALVAHVSQVVLANEAVAAAGEQVGVIASDPVDWITVGSGQL